MRKERKTPNRAQTRVDSFKTWGLRRTEPPAPVIVDVDGTVDIGPLHMQIEAIEYSLEDLWNHKENMLATQQASLEKWEKTLDSDQRRVLQQMVVEGLQTLVDDPSWIPHRLELKDGNVLQITTTVVLTSVNEEVQKQEAAYLRELDRCTKIDLNLPA